MISGYFVLLLRTDLKNWGISTLMDHILNKTEKTYEVVPVSSKQRFFDIYLYEHLHNLLPVYNHIASNLNILYPYGGNTYQNNMRY